MKPSEHDEAPEGLALKKRDLVNRIAKDTGLTQLQVLEIVQRTLDGIVDALEAGQHVEFREFGVFSVVRRKARIGRNPNQPADVVTIPIRHAVKFKPGKRMRDMLSKKK
ncbi:MAG: HU family DNA-binding protein [Kiritimatiellia bacterium]|jgi:DNA-binding protein HU-beta/integration host factor subunit alpha|nr:HU family DNA-binding protein [Kiritimatiellia bacterium]